MAQVAKYWRRNQLRYLMEGIQQPKANLPGNESTIEGIPGTTLEGLVAPTDDEVGRADEPFTEGPSSSRESTPFAGSKERY